MPMQATATSPRHRGWHFDQVNNRLAAVYNGTEVFDFDANDMIVTPATSFSGAVTMDTTLLVTGVATFTATPVFNSATATTFNSDLLIANGFGTVIGHSAQITMNALVPEFQVIGTTVGVDGAAAIGLYSATAAEGPVLNFFRSKSATLGTNTIVASADSLGGIQWMGADGSTGFDPAAAIIAEVAATPGATNDMPGRILFQTSPDGTQTPATRMTILAGATTVAQAQLGTAGTSTGAVLMAGATSGVVTLTVGAAAGTWTMQLPAAVGGAGEQLTDAGANGVTSWSAAASRREYKTDIEVIDHEAGAALDRMVNRHVYAFRYNKDVGKGTGDFETRYEGVMADEYPEAMHFHGGIVNPVNTFGETILAIKALAEKVARLEGAVA